MITESTSKIFSRTNSESPDNSVISPSPFAYVQCDKSSKILQATSNSSSFLDTSNRQLIGQSLWDYLPESSHNKKNRTLKNIEQTGSDQWILHHPDRGTWIEVNFLKEVDGFGAFLQDITTRVNAETLLEIKREILQSMALGSNFNQTTQLICNLIDKLVPGSITSILLLDQVKEVLMFQSGGTNLPPDLGELLDGLAPSKCAGSCGTAAFRGEPVYVEDTLTDPLWEQLVPVAKEYGIRSCWSVPIISDENQVLGTFAISNKRTGVPTAFQKELLQIAAHVAGIALKKHLNEAELDDHRTKLEELVEIRSQQLEESKKQLQESERLSSLGILCAGIAHEINNPLGLINLITYKTRKLIENCKCDSCEELSAQNREIEEQVDRCSKIINNVLRFARSEETEKSPTNLNDLLRRAIDFSRDFARKEDVEIDLHSDPALPEVSINNLEIEQVLVNVIRNAIQASEPHSKIRIESQIAVGGVKINIIDQGKGMSSEHLEHIFDPFFTTRVNEGGTGLGMSVSHGLILGNNGSIDVQSQPGEGTHVTIQLPLNGERS